MSRKGEKLFQQCEVKEIKYQKFVFHEGEEAIVSLAENLPNKGVGSIYAGDLAVLHCPRSPYDESQLTSEYLAGRNKINSYDELKKAAGELICEGCRFSGMSRVQAMEERTQFVRAESDQMEALAALEKARNEVNSMTSFEHKPRLYE